MFLLLSHDPDSHLLLGSPLLFRTKEAAMAVVAKDAAGIVADAEEDGETSILRWERASLAEHGDWLSPDNETEVAFVAGKGATFPDDTPHAVWSLSPISFEEG